MNLGNRDDIEATVAQLRAAADLLERAEHDEEARDAAAMAEAAAASLRRICAPA